jgi:hypothetical protein
MPAGTDTLCIPGQGSPSIASGYTNATRLELAKLRHREVTVHGERTIILEVFVMTGFLVEAGVDHGGYSRS